ncbi:MAG: hypothetical protein ACSHX6_16185 [Akkermansiaceae bacterium]
MAEKKNNGVDKKRDDSEEIIERLDPIIEGEEDLDTTFAEESGMVDDEIDRLFEKDNEKRDSSLDILFEDDRELDSLFDEERKSFQKGLKDEVQKALSQPTMSKASLYRMRMSEPSESALTAEIAQQKTVEEIWEEPLGAAKETQNKKSIWVMCSFIALVSMAGAWALWQSTNGTRGNEEELLAQEVETEQKELSKLELEQQLQSVDTLMHQYFTANTVDQKCESIYKADSLRSDIEAYYKENGGPKPSTDYRIDNIFPMEIDETELWEVFIKDKNDLEKDLKVYYVRKDPAGAYKVDWKADVVFQENDIGHFQETRSKEATSFRFKVEPMYKLATFNWGFTDTEYDVLRLSIPDTDWVFWGYLKRGSEAHKKLLLSLDLNLKRQVLDMAVSHDFILKVKFLEDSPKENDQYILIDELVSRKWINIAE